jgi:hypothetical protein
MAWAFVIWFFLPDSPLSPGRFFKQEEKDILAQRFYETSRARDRQPFRWYQFKEALLEIKTWIYLLMGAAIYVSFLCPMADTVLTLDVQRIDNRLRCAHHQVLGL